MDSQNPPQLAELYLKDRQLLETCGKEAFHQAKKAKILLSNTSIKDQLKSN